MITRHLVLGCILAALSLLTSAAAQDAGERLELRVVSTGVSGSVVVDRGQADGVAVGDAVLFRPRAGGEYRGTVARVEERSAVVQLDDRSFTATPGTRGEVFVPASRRPTVQPARPQPNQPPDQHFHIGQRASDARRQSIMCVHSRVPVCKM